MRVLEGSVQGGSWLIDLKRRELRDSSGRHVTLRRRSLGLLLYLAGKPDHVIGKDELVAENWSGIAVTDDSLTKCISDIRNALGPALRDTIRTISGRGYMLSGWEADATDERLTFRALPHVAAHPRRPGNLASARPLIGRAEDVRRIGDLLARKRLVTVIGAGGVGKTSAAIAAAGLITESYPDGVWIVELGPIQSAALIPSTLRSALRLETTGDHLTAVLDFLADKSMLILVDNCEHLVEATGDVVGSILAAAPGVGVLATSREPLRLQDEQLFRLGTLRYPPEPTCTAPEALTYPAVALLAERAALALDGFVLEQEDVPAAVDICRRLDGIALALVLAAARLAAMSLQDLAASLDRRFDLLTSGPRRSAQRQRTLRSMIDWSYDMLAADEQAVFAELAVFAGHASIEDIAAVCRGGDHRSADEVLLSLFDKSLVISIRDPSGRTRYGFLETTRQYAAERLDAQHSHAARLRLVRRMIDIFTEAEIGIETEATITWRNRYAPGLDNLRAALAWVFEQSGETDLAIALATASAPLFDEMSLLTERREWIDRAMRAATGETPPFLLGKLNLWGAMRSSWVRHWDKELSGEAARLFMEAGASLWQGRALAMEAVGYGYEGRWDEAWPLITAGEAALRPLGPTRALSATLRYWGTMLIWKGLPREAEPLIDEAAEIAASIGYQSGFVRAHVTRAEIAFEHDDVRAAIRLSAEAVATAREADDLNDLVLVGTLLVAYRLIGGEIAKNREDLLDLFDMDQRLGDVALIRTHIELAAFYLALNGDLTNAALLAHYAKRTNDRPQEEAERFERVIRSKTADLLSALSDSQPTGDRPVERWTVRNATAHAIRLLQR